MAEWLQAMIRFPGIIGKKLGMTQIFGEDGVSCGVTVVKAGPCIVTKVVTKEKEGYDALQLGFEETRRLNKPQKGHLKDLPGVRYLREFRLQETSPQFKRGDKIEVNLFKEGELVNVTGISKGKGFAGVVKRWGFAGGPKTRGQSDRWRAPGAIGATTPGKVYKGKKMAGHMGYRRVTVKNLKIVKIIPEKHLLLVEGAVPGARNSLLLISKVV